MKNLTIFASDKIRLHPNAIDTDGLGLATEPYLTLPLDASDSDLHNALFQCLKHSKSGLPPNPWREKETDDYYEQLGVKSQKDLGIGADVLEENGLFTVTPINKRGEFGEPVEVEEAELVGRCGGVWGCGRRRDEEVLGFRAGQTHQNIVAKWV